MKEEMDMPELKALAKKTREIRAAMHLTQAEFAAQCGISEKTLVAIEHEHGNAKLSTLHKIAVFGHSSIAEMVDIRKKRTRKKRV